jgi:hypothetical protein
LPELESPEIPENSSSNNEKITELQEHYEESASIDQNVPIESSAIDDNESAGNSLSLHKDHVVEELNVNSLIDDVNDDNLNSVPGSNTHNSGESDIIVEHNDNPSVITSFESGEQQNNNDVTGSNDEKGDLIPAEPIFEIDMSEFMNDDGKIIDKTDTFSENHVAQHNDITGTDDDDKEKLNDPIFDIDMSDELMGDDGKIMETIEPFGEKRVEKQMMSNAHSRHRH